MAGLAQSRAAPGRLPRGARRQGSQRGRAPSSAAAALQHDQQTISKACGKDQPTRLAHGRCTMEVRQQQGPPQAHPDSAPH